MPVQEPVYRFRGNAALPFLEKNLFRYKAGTYAGGQEAIRLHVARNPGE